MVSWQESLTTVVEVLVHVLVVSLASECSITIYTWLFITKAWNKVLIVCRHISLLCLLCERGWSYASASPSYLCNTPNPHLRICEAKP